MKKKTIQLNLCLSGLFLCLITACGNPRVDFDVFPTGLYSGGMEVAYFAPYRELTGYFFGYRYNEDSSLVDSCKFFWAGTYYGEKSIIHSWEQGNRKEKNFGTLERLGEDSLVFYFEKDWSACVPQYDFVKGQHFVLASPANYHYITSIRKNNSPLFAQANEKAEILSVMNKFLPVRVFKRSEHWQEIEFEKNGKRLRGWVQSPNIFRFSG